MLLYILFGILTTAVNILSFGLLRDVLQWQLLTANTLAWVLSVAFAFLTNKVFVFRSKSFAAKLVLRELVSFVGARLFSLAVDTAGMWLLVDVLTWNDWLAKVLMNVIVIVLNYVFSKLFIFKRPQ
nr:MULTISPECIES: GtrA family protein [Anaeromassilibacillus]